MKQVMVGGMFTILAAIVTGGFTWFSAQKKHKIEIKAIKENTISKNDVVSNYVEKSEYESLKDKIKNKELTMLQENFNSLSYIDSLKKELKYLKLKCEKIATIPKPTIKFEEDKMLFEIEKAYQEGKFIVLNLRLTNLGNDRTYSLESSNTIVQTLDGLEYNLKDILKGGRDAYKIRYSFKHKEDVLYTLYFGDVSSQLKYNKFTFKTITRNDTKISKEVKISFK